MEETQKELLANIAPFGLRMQPDLKDRIKAEAERSNRSMNAEIVARLEESLDPLVINVRKTGDIYGELDKIVERTLRKVQEEERSAATIPGDEKLTPEIVRALAQFMHEGETPRAEAIKLILEQWLTEHGYLKASE
ncbi:Arc family DNA-binding protein [Rhizobium leguminosarum]|uniref:Arc family DNA-binding protein n=1 Tax=Rhizobium leguminosarum TaxID=384 RepID=UPI0013DB2961|nr:Arc family DNA-binding protein [Rhizobium leguminosarum]NEK36315.1 Arc family DNA-binding protein [Rhizobium leguminosarum]